MRIVKKIFCVVILLVSTAVTNNAQAMAQFFESCSQPAGIFLRYAHAYFVPPEPVDKFPHYNEDLAKEYKRTINTQVLVKDHLNECSEKDIPLSTHEVIDTVGRLMEEYALKPIKKQTDPLYELHINGIRFMGQKALCIAAEKGCTEIVEILLYNGVSVDTKNDKAETLLHLASKNGHYNTADLLCRRGVDMFARDGGGCTALHALRQNNMLSQESQSKIADLLVYYALEIINTPNKLGETPLDLVPADRADFIQLLKECGAVIGVQTKK